MEVILEVAANDQGCERLEHGGGFPVDGQVHGREQGAADEPDHDQRFFVIRFKVRLVHKDEGALAQNVERGQVNDQVWILLNNPVPETVGESRKQRHEWPQIATSILEACDQ